ncbi:MAG: DUF2207 domain-containing protein [Oscillospiraceae bacterium]|nr:DUF2207 domain-containing protein [Oscillospiraceae bacterium]
MNIFRKLFFSVTAALCLTAGAVLASAQNNVSEMDIEVVLQNDGSAYIVQTWRGTFHEGTENYIPISTQDIAVSQLKVSDQYGEYEFVDYWDVDASFEEKSRKCGINETYDGVELCFGISEYGENVYAIEYVVEDFIKSYSDYDGTNFMLVNPGMSTFPTDVTAVVVMNDGTYLSEENTAIWGFGFDGMVEFYEGCVVAYSNTALSGEDSMILMLRLDKGIVSPAYEEDCSFDEVKDRAFEGSDYDDDDVSIVGIIVFFGIIAVMIWTAVWYIKRKIAIKKFFKAAPYFRDVPNDGSMAVTYYLSQNFDAADEESLIIGALIISMINDGVLEAVVEEETGFLGRSKQNVSLKIIKEPKNILQKQLYDILKISAGDDGILQEKELENYSYANPEVITSFISKVKEDGETEFAAKGGFANGAGNCIKDLNEKGKSELAQVVGLKKYLDEFSLISEREISETVIWQDYMIYAALLGIADKVMEQFKKVYPEKVAEIDRYERNVMASYRYRSSMYGSAQRAIQKKRSEGRGGRASHGGGGGFSGGGRGGGSR